MKWPALPAFVFLFALAGPALADNPASLQPAAVQFIPAQDSRFRYEGRVDFADPSAPVIIWAGTRISVDFTGRALALHFDGAMGQNFFNAEVDGVMTVVAASAGASGRIELPVTAGPARHHLELFKRTEAAAGHVRFRGMEIAGNAQATVPAPPGYRLRMEFLGDSIMAGACNEDGAEDQWENRATHNNALSYTALTAAAFRADYRCMAVSGMGIAAGYVEVKAGQVWDRLYSAADAPRANLQAWQPDVVLINFGENDDSFPRGQGQPFPPTYTAGYVALAKAVRAAYPRAELVLLRGGMYSGSQSAPLIAAWTTAVREIEAADPAASDFVFTHWSQTHPRVSDDRAMEAELVAWLKQQPFMRKFF